MKSGPNEELLRLLAYEWAEAELPGERSFYGQYLRVIRQLHTVTRSRKRTRFIFQGVLNQAIELGKSSAWVEREIKFEELAEAIFRGDLIRIQLNYSHPIDDAALDAYNERMSRFNTVTKPE